MPSREAIILTALLLSSLACVVVAGSRSVHLDCSEHGQNLEARLDAYSSPDLLVLERCTLQDIGNIDRLN